MALVRNQILHHGRCLVQALKQAPRQTTIQSGLNSLICKKLHSTINISKGAICLSQHMPQISARPYTTTPASAPKVNSISCEDESLSITWDGNVRDTFPYVWLRDCCLCDKCYVHTSKARRLVMQDIDPEIKPQNVTIDDSKKEILITWPGGHVSEFGFDWLHQRAYNNRNRKIRHKWLAPAHELWGRKEMEGNIPTDSIQNILNDEKALFKFLFETEKKGLHMLTGAPLEVGQLEKLADRIAFLRTTNYGVTFHVQVKSDATNPAYTSAPLGLHCDVPFYDYIPGVWLTHCIKQYSGKGGSSTVADGIYVAEKMRRERPDLFKILTDTPIDFYDVGDDHYKFYMLRQGPTIKLDQHGSVAEIVYNNQDRDYYLDLPPEKVKPLYTALRYWDDILYREENHIDFKLKEGDVIVLDNRRVLHGRTGFDTSPDAAHDMSRHLEGIYFDWDEIRSRRRQLQYDLGLEEHPPIH